jgi:hypothetical protein
MREVSSNSHPAAAERLGLCRISVMAMSTVTTTYLNGKIGTGFLDLDGVRVAGSQNY